MREDNVNKSASQIRKETKYKNRKDKIATDPYQMI